VVYQNMEVARLSVTGIFCAIASLGCMTIGAILQKRLKQKALEVLPLQYGSSLHCISFLYRLNR
jgi:hypothetical protein